MTRYWPVLAGLLRALALISAIVVIVFLLIRAVPGDAVDVLAAQGDLTARQQAALRTELGLDATLAGQLRRWVAHAATGDLGQSLRFGRPVAAMVTQALPTTLGFAAAAFAFGFALALLLAVGALLAPRSPLPALVEAVNLWSIAVPTFVAGIVAILVFSIWLGWLPVIGNLPVPIVVLGLDIAGQLAKPLLEELREARLAPHVRAAHARGLHPLRIVLRHVLPAALPVLLALASVSLASLIGGTLTMEALFGLPGLGSLVLNAVNGRDYPVLQAVIIVLALGVVLVNAVADLARRLIDPRVRA
ncbi:ABC transporter permease [Rhodovastum atsumiense]|uniref:ABC transporter permease n=1 Tax=Rhodovastum atsumiense TaxID=504468 RepID=A0A5M6IR18_9PROT|nr:ABC transporter permease [Rhodovastum atsumiense]KAA5610397.1 ABC transporter permease [Rhodovastum atsumiense]CAH2602923.1 ABC transporter permease [Rhodovastum atsumiense]